MLDKSFVEKIEELSKLGEIKNLNGRNYAVGELQSIKEPVPEPLKVNTLKSIRVMYEHLKEKDIKTFVHVKSPTEVVLYGRELDGWANRSVYAIADASEYVSSFRQAKFMDLEDFVISVNRSFLKTPSRDELLQLVSSIKVENESNISDDGVAQTVTAKAGTHLVSKVKIKNPMSLMPLCTFPEIESRVKDYVLRVRHDGGVEVALFNIESRAWERNTLDDMTEVLISMGVDQGDII